MVDDLTITQVRLEEKGQVQAICKKAVNYTLGKG